MHETLRPLVVAKLVGGDIKKPYVANKNGHIAMQVNLFAIDVH